MNSFITICHLNIKLTSIYKSKHSNVATHTILIISHSFRSITELEAQLDYERLRREKLEAQLDEYRREIAFLNSQLDDTTHLYGVST